MQMKIVDNVTWREINDELVVLDLTSGKYLTLNSVARDVWKGIIDEKSVDEIVSAIESEYEVDIQTAKADVQEFVKQLLDRQLIATE